MFYREYRVEINIVYVLQRVQSRDKYCLCTTESIKYTESTE